MGVYAGRGHVCSRFLVGIDAPFGRNRIEKGRFPCSSRVTGLFSYVGWGTPPPPFLFLGACFHAPFSGRGRFTSFPFHVFGMYRWGVSLDDSFIFNHFLRVRFVWVCDAYGCGMGALGEFALSAKGL